FVKKAVAGVSAVLNNIFFDVGKYTLRSESEVELNKVVRFVQDNPGMKIEIQGHTDDTGDKKANQLLSENRAAEVFKYLINKGINEEVLQYVGKGEEEPLASNDTEENKQKNRRIEFKIIEH
ncbi:MAG: OmpA family protein, partial [Cyclobacteriaceae bacterium]|nr:OmpA family protein [Cyclobacteriaceae bacterium]